MNLFYKYGGTNFWNDVLNSFYDKALRSARLAHFFTPCNLPHIKNMLLSQLEISLGADFRYSMEGLEQSHKHLGITSEQFSEWVVLYRETLIEKYVLYEDIEKIIGSLRASKKFIISKP